MEKKDIKGLIKLFGIGAVIGLIAAIIMIVIDVTGNPLDIKAIPEFIVNKSHVIYIVGLIVFIIPALIFISKGKKTLMILAESNDIEDQAYDAMDLKSKKYFDLGILLNGIYLILVLFLYGATYDMDQFGIGLVRTLILFALIFICAVIEVSTVKFIQKHDPRLKGNPTSTSFQKVYVESMDEAEKLKTYKAGYDAFMMSRNIGIGIMALFMVLQIFFEIGISYSALSGLFVIINQVTYTIYEIRNNC